MLAQNTRPIRPPTTRPFRSPDRPDRLKALQDAIVSLQHQVDSWPYCPPEDQANDYFRTVAWVFNILDPNQVIATPIVRR